MVVDDRAVFPAGQGLDTRRHVPSLSPKPARLLAQTMTNVSRLRASVRAAKIPPEDAAGVQLAMLLAGLLDEAEPPPSDPDKAIAAMAAGRNFLTLSGRLEIAKVVAPKYLAVLRDLGLTRAGRGATPANSIPTAGAAAGASQDAAAHERHRQRFSERAGG